MCQTDETRRKGKGKGNGGKGEHGGKGGFGSKGTHRGDERVEVAQNIGGRWLTPPRPRQTWKKKKQKRDRRRHDC